MKRQIDFTQGSIIRAIVLFSIPLILGELLQNLYNSADALIVGNFVDENALAAVTVCGTISSMVVTFFNGMSVGSNVVVATACGRGDWQQVCRISRVAFSFGVLLGAVLSVLGIFLAPQLLLIADTQDAYYAEALTYLRIYLAGLMFTVIYNNAAGILRALGRSDVPFRILVVSCAVNIVLDLILVVVFRLGVAGVGIATVVSQAISVALVYRALNRSLKCRCFDLRDMWQHGGEIVLSILRIGMTAGLQSALISLSNIFIVRYMNLFSTEAVAGIGIAQKLDKFVILPAKSFGITMTTFIGQNLGAGHYERIREGCRKCLFTAVGVTLALSALLFLFTDQCVALFSPDPKIIAVGAAMMHVLIPMFWVLATREVIMGILRGCGYNLWPAVLSLVGMIGIRQLFLSITMRTNPVIENIYRCYPLAWASTALLLLIYYLCVRKHLLPTADQSPHEL